ncbi:hypothetical protein [Phaeodactylibacter sp.]|uniref:hypothetical protein n=1 Tax=Phaeodactylibacter sp. TaxID=1940289 RepID=UPI0034125A3E
MQWAVLQSAVLQWAVLQWAVLQSAVLQSAVLESAVLQWGVWAWGVGSGGGLIRGVFKGTCILCQRFVETSLLISCRMFMWLMKITECTNTGRTGGSNSILIITPGALYNILTLRILSICFCSIRSCRWWLP